MVNLVICNWIHFGDKDFKVFCVFLQIYKSVSPFYGECLTLVLQNVGMVSCGCLIMCLQVCLCLVSVGSANPARSVRSGVPRIQAVTPEPATILNYVNQRNEDGSYTYGFQVSWCIIVMLVMRDEHAIF